MSSKRRLRRNACGGKVRYATAEAARNTVGRLVRTATVQFRTRGWLAAYRCRYCGGFHVGHSGR